MTVIEHELKSDKILKIKMRYDISKMKKIIKEKLKRRKMEKKQVKTVVRVYVRTYLINKKLIV